MEKIAPLSLNWLIKEWDEISESLYKTFGSGSALILRCIGSGIGKGYAEAIKGYGLTLQESLPLLQEYFIKRALGKLLLSKMMNNASERIIIQETGLRNPQSRYILYGIITGFLEEAVKKKIHLQEIRNDFPTLLEAKIHFIENEV